MPDMTTKEGVVAYGVELMQKAKVALATAESAFDDMEAMFNAGGDLEMARALHVYCLKASAKVARGHVAMAMSEVGELHVECTKIAKANGADGPIIAGGGGGR